MSVLFTHKTIHFVGIGGIGMSGIAEVLLRMGFSVQGSDLRPSAQSQRLESLGARIFSGHSATNTDHADVVVYSSACSPDNVELLAAKEKKIPAIRRAEMLAELMRMKFGIAVAGAHGKTTTTSMIGQILHNTHLDPTVIIGGRLALFDSNARHGQGKIMVAEADESDGSFLHLNPAIAITTNIDREHLNHYQTMDNLKQAFVGFLNKVPFYGTAIACIECPTLRELLPQVRTRVRTYGFSDKADLFAPAYHSKDLGTEFEVFERNENGTVLSLGLFHLKMSGRHNVLNALAALSVARELEIPLADVRRALGSFGGVDRRLQILHRSEKLWLIDDYGHHPTEILATFQAVREFRKGRLITLFQPHRFSRTQDLWKEFTTCFRDTDVLLMLDVYPACEEPIQGISTSALCQAISRQGETRVVDLSRLARNDVLASIEELLQPGDTLLTLGAGVTSEYAKALRDRFQSHAALESAAPL